MSRVCGVIAEYNPFHNGHLWQLKEIRRRLQPDVLVVVMSGNFVQRGEVALVDKWQRTKMALAAGVDLVVELPIYASVQPADIFALEALRLLQQLGVTDLVFGSENPELDYLTVARKIQKIPRQAAAFQDYRQTYATQLNQLLERYLGFQLTKPNQMLGLAYAQASLQLNYPLNFHPYLRTGLTEHNQVTLQGEISSATAIRTAIQAGRAYQETVPATSWALLEQKPHYYWSQFYPLLRYRLLTATAADLQAIYQMNEGLQYKLQQAAVSATDFTNFLYQIKSKRFTWARLRRLCLYTVLNLTTEQMQEMRMRAYLHVLGFNQVGQQHLHVLKSQNLTLPVITKVTQKLGNRQGIMARAIQADRLLLLGQAPEQNFGRRPLYQREV
ncbi:nucleotidyltransferase [Lactobacillus sp. DCY120]|uniref:tRNA(Met) cytidine acetate ligase n=1 Tax=Bombilactobacillus apium TaxID=2675299 RepID=A0A850R8P6_9LACO|nr:nucleotidyltransferase [Bombilactobacillus apium]NVY96905.1 nucleotidyltransferase [Bombilactobacillus apium]